MTRKKFIESHGADCNNWTWSWSFVNKKKHVIIFGTWSDLIKGNKAEILNEKWQRRSTGRKQPGYTQAIEHIRLIEEDGYQLKTFMIINSKARKDTADNGPAKIAEFTPKLEEKKLKRIKDSWYAIDV